MHTENGSDSVKESYFFARGILVVVVVVWTGKSSMSLLGRWKALRVRASALLIPFRPTRASVVHAV